MRIVKEASAEHEGSTEKQRIGESMRNDRQTHRRYPSGYRGQLKKSRKTRGETGRAVRHHSPSKIEYHIKMEDTKK